MFFPFELHVSHDIVIKQFDHYVKLPSKPAVLLGACQQQLIYSGMLEPTAVAFALINILHLCADVPASFCQNAS